MAFGPETPFDFDFSITHGRDYNDSGDNYDEKDPFKVYALEKALITNQNVADLGFQEVLASRGESAHVVDVGPFYLAFTVEGLGTKNKATQKVEDDNPGESYHAAAAIDTVATIANDIITVGARPLVINPHWAFGSNDFLKNETRYKAIIDGWVQGCNEAGAIYGGGESPTNKGIVFPDMMEFSGSGYGVIWPKERLTLGEKLAAGDHIVLIESSGAQTNGISLIRDIAAENLPDGFQTVLPSGRTLGQAVLTPSRIYAKLQNSLFQAGIAIHYMSHITGHGWRKIMRADRDFTYRMHQIPFPPEEFFLLHHAGPVSVKEMYGTFNMGAAFAFYVPEDDAPKVQDLAWQKGLRSWDAGIVEEGPRRVIIEPLGIEFGDASLKLR